MQTPIISVIVPVYKVEEFLPRCVDSLLRQTFRDIQIILVDDGSPDRCGAMCDAYREKDSRICVLHKENGGLSDARNAGLALATGEYVIFIDSDDFVEPDMLRALYDLMTEYGADISVCGTWNCYADHRKRQFPEDRTFVCTGEEALRLTLEGNLISGQVWNKLICRSTLAEHRFLKGKTYEDAFFLPELYRAAKKVAVTTKPLYHYWHRRCSITGAPFSPSAMDFVEAYRYTLDFVTAHYPQLIPQAQFRLQWSHFMVLDKLILVKGFRKMPQYPQLVGYLQKNWKAIFRSPYFRAPRRLSALALRCGVVFYRLLAGLNRTRNRENAG